MNQGHSGKKTPVIYGDSILESIRDVSSGVSRTVTQDVVAKISQDALSSILGTNPNSGDMKPNESVEFQPEKHKTTHRSNSEVHPRIIPRVERNLEAQIQGVRNELAALSKAMKSLDTEIQRAIIDQPVSPGIYHLNYFDRLRQVIKLIRQNIEDSRTWLSMHTGRKKRKNYWGMYKKHGTTFGLSYERTLATSAG